MISLDNDLWAKLEALGSVVSGIAGLLGVSFAALAGRVALRLYRIESERDRRTEEREQAANDRLARLQASAIGFWRSGPNKMILANLSQLPIHDIFFGVLNFGSLYALSDEPTERFDYGALDFAFPLRPSDGQTLHFLRPQEERSLEPIQSRSFEAESTALGALDLPFVAFSDNAGIYWIRWEEELFRPDAVWTPGQVFGWRARLLAARADLDEGLVHVEPIKLGQ